MDGPYHRASGAGDGRTTTTERTGGRGKRRRYHRRCRLLPDTEHQRTDFTAIPHGGTDTLQRPSPACLLQGKRRVGIHPQEQEGQGRQGRRENRPGKAPFVEMTIQPANKYRIRVNQH